MKFYLVAAFVSAFLFFHGADAAPKETSGSGERLVNSDAAPSNEISEASLCGMMKEYVQINTVLATVSRYPAAVASKIESNLSEVSNKYSSNTNVQTYIGYVETVLKNRGGLRMFDFLERAGINRFENVICAKPELFAPLFNSFERVLEHTTAGSAPSEVERSVSEFEAESPNEADQAPGTPMCRFKQFVEVNTALAKVARTSPEVASEIDSVIAELQKTSFPENTPFGQALGRMRLLLNNRRSLVWFVFLDQAGIGKLEKLIVSKPDYFKDAEESPKQN